MSIFLNNFGFVKAAPETTYGSHPQTGDDDHPTLGTIDVLADRDAVYVEEIDCNEDYDPIQRAGKSKERPGWAPQTGLITPNFTAQVELRPSQMFLFNMNAEYEVDSNGDGNDDNTGLALTSAVDRHALPGGALWLLSCGFRIEPSLCQEGNDSVASPQDARLTFIPDVFSAPSITLENYTRKYQTSGEAYIRQVMSGCRADATLSIRAGGRLMLDLDGGAKSYSLEDYEPYDNTQTARKVLPIYNDDGVAPDGLAQPAVSTAQTTESEFRQAFVGLNSTVTLSYVDGNGTTVSLNAAGVPAQLLDLEVQFNNGLTYPRTMSEDGSVSEVILAPTDNMGIRFKLEAEDIAVWDIQDIVKNKRLITFNIQTKDRETDRDYIEIAGTCALANAPFGEEDNRLVWECEGSIVYQNQGDPFTSGNPLLSITWVTPYT